MKLGQATSSKKDKWFSVVRVVCDILKNMCSSKFVLSINLCIIIFIIVGPNMLFCVASISHWYTNYTEEHYAQLWLRWYVVAFYSGRNIQNIKGTSSWKKSQIFPVKGVEVYWGYKTIWNQGIIHCHWRIHSLSTEEL